MSEDPGRPLIRPFRDGDQRAVNDAFNAVFGTARGLDEWAWKFPAEPEGRHIMLAVEASGAVVAQYAAVPVRLRKDALEVTAGQIGDVFTRPGARHGLGAARLFVRTYDTFVATWCNPGGLAVCYGFPGARALGLGLARLSYDDVPPQEVPYLCRAVAPRSAWPLLSRYRTRVGFEREAVSALWQACKARYRVTAVRDAGWFERRFQGRPGVDYTHLSVWRGDKPRAWAVLRRVHESMKWAELLWDGRDPKALRALMRAVERESRRLGASLMELWLGGDDEARGILVDGGWTPMRQPDGLHLIVRIFHPGFAVEDFPGRFYLTMGDGDLV